MVKVDPRNGRLAYRFCLNSDQWREATALRDTSKNREKLERKCQAINDLIAEGRFDYLAWFPNGNRAARFRPAPPSAPVQALTITDYATRWEKRNQPPTVRRSLAKTRSKDLRNHILPAFGPTRLDALTPTALLDFRSTLTSAVEAGGKGLKLKTARCIMDSTFRALVRDARLVDYRMAYGTTEPVGTDPFAVITWMRAEDPEPDPFDAGERDTLLEYFWNRKRSYYAFVYTLFHVGLRTGEAIGLRWGSLDLRRAQLTVKRSRSYGEDNAPKTKGSARTLRLRSDVAAVLREAQPLRAGEDAFVFTTGAGLAIDRDRFVDKHWRPALRATGIRPRKCYATRHTFISLALMDGCTAKWVAKYCGTSLEMLDRHYSKWMGDDDAELAKLGAGHRSSSTKKSA